MSPEVVGMWCLCTCLVVREGWTQQFYLQGKETNIPITCEELKFFRTRGSGKWELTLMSSESMF